MIPSLTAPSVSRLLDIEDALYWIRDLFHLIWDLLRYFTGALPNDALEDDLAAAPGAC